MTCRNSVSAPNCCARRRTISTRLHGASIRAAGTTRTRSPPCKPASMKTGRCSGRYSAGWRRYNRGTAKCGTPSLIVKGGTEHSLARCFYRSGARGRILLPPLLHNTRGVQAMDAPFTFTEGGGSHRHNKTDSPAHRQGPERGYGIRAQHGLH